MTPTKNPTVPLRLSNPFENLVEHAPRCAGGVGAAAVVHGDHRRVVDQQDADLVHDNGGRVPGDKCFGGQLTVGSRQRLGLRTQPRHIQSW